MIERDMSDQVEAFLGLVEHLAAQVAASAAARVVGAEYDDLRQEGLIIVWLSLQRGVTPSAEIIEYRMQNWIEFLASKSPVPYELMLPLEDFTQRAGSG